MKQRSDQYNFKNAPHVWQSRVMLVGLLLFFTTNVLQASTDSLFVVSGNQGGIGIGFDVDSINTRITQIFPNTPAARSGQLNVGDRIIGVGQGASGGLIEITGKSSQEVVNLISGPVGAKVRLAILHADQNESDPPIIVELVREYIQRRINLSNVKTWHFKNGDNPEWANPNFDHSDWLKMGQVDVREPFPDSLWNKGCGWFRTYFKADSTFYFNPWYLQLYTFGAAEVYMDGKLINSFGVFSTDPKLEKRYNPLLKTYTPIWLSPKDTHLIAVRFSYHNAKWDKEIMEKRDRIFGFWLAFQSQRDHDLNNEQIKNADQLSTVIISVLSVLSILFWLIVLFNRSQVHVVYLAATTTLFLLPTLLAYLDRTATFTTNLSFLFDVLRFPSAVAWVASFIFLVASILQIRVHRLIKVYLTIALLSSFSIYFFPYLLEYVGLSVLISVAGICIYYLIRYRKKLIGPKAIIVYGLLLAFSLALVWYTFYDEDPYIVPFIIPLSLLVYIAFWMREMIQNIQIKAEALVRVADEKKDIVENQNILLEEQVQVRTKELNASLENLKSTQSQLIHSEKMASLGELTAGIAHEIQNPLNFVNNFSDVSRELISELKEELEGGDIKEAKAISDDVSENLEKINYHGQRASDIVKGMLEHSRSGDGKKEPTDINKLADEYLRLAYHGLRAKDKSFNADFELDLEKSIPKVNLVPQEIGRVLLNLINNAFQACNEPGQRTDSTNHKPKVIVTTKNLGDKIIITVADNGPGIPEQVRDKIFQPFFTTKPTGQGTGLGLSMSYDIVKAHDGTLTVKTAAGQGATFIIELPYI